MHPKPRQIQDEYHTYGKGRAVRLREFDYAQDVPTHLTICARCNVIESEALARAICDNVEFYCRKLQFDRFCYCLMPDHLHLLLSPGGSGVPISRWLNSFKSFTTHEYMKRGGKPPLWQLSAHDHVCRKSETTADVVMYIANNPVRKGLAEKWDDWPWTKVFVEV
jgi:REP element-mobilizing transposase RayT